MTQEERKLYDAANEYARDIESGDLNTNRDSFIAGANWRYEQFEKERLKHCDELTAEQAQIESDFVVQHLKKCNRTPTFIDAIEYGSEAMMEKVLSKLENLCRQWSLCTSAEAKYRLEAYKELLEIFKGE